MEMSGSTRATARTVLLADDAAVVRDRFNTALGSAGHRLITARTGEELLSRAQEAGGEIDLVVLDLRLPPGDGIEMVRSLKGIEGLTAPVLVFSGTIAGPDEVRALAALGVSGYINEYTSVQHIVRSLASHLFPERDNRRISARVMLGTPVSYEFGNAVATALTLNVGLGGLAVRTTQALEPGTELRVRFRLPGGETEIEARARVSWVDRLTGMGLEFTQVDGLGQAAIDEFVHGHVAANQRSS
jgi:uncharacterized protein (TIGR02266 family)